MDRILFSQCRWNSLRSVGLTTRNFNGLHQSPYVRPVLSAGRCDRCKTQQVSRFSGAKLTKQELKAWKGILRASDTLRRHHPLLYSAGRRLYSEQQPKQDQDGQGGQGEKPPPGGQDINIFMVMGVLFGLGIWLMITRVLYNDRIEMSWSTFENDFLLKGQVERLHLFKFQQNQVVEAELHQDSEYRRRTGRRRILIDVVSRDDFAEKLHEFERKHNIPEHEKLPVSFSKEPSYLQPLITLAIVLLLVAVISRSRRRISKDVENQIKFPGGMSSNIVDSSGRAGTKKDLTKFAQIAGQKEAIVELKEFVDYVTKPLKYQKMGAKVPRGALLTGPPGCGKTLLAKALAGESQVPFYAMAGSEFIEIFGGLGAARVRNLFKKARANAPCIIYIDEIDTIGRSRSGGGGRQSEGLSSETESTLNQLLVEMDGMTTVDGVIVLASTNRAEILDKALLRPGRFDRHILVDLPTLQEREELFQLYLSSIKTDSTTLPSTITRMAQMTPGMSGADIANVCNEAAIYAARHQKTSVGDTDLDYAIERVVAGVAKANRTISPAERKVVAYHEAGHVIAKCFLEGADKLLKVSIVPRTSEKPSFSRFQPSDRRLHTKEDLFTEMCVSLGGRAAEAIVFNKVTSAAEDDLKKVTKIAYNQIKTFGMSSVVGLLSFPTDEEVGTAFGKKPYSKNMARRIDLEAKQLVAQAYQETEELLRLHRVNLDKVANELLERETLNKEQLAKLLGFKMEESEEAKSRFPPDIELL